MISWALLICSVHVMLPSRTQQFCFTAASYPDGSQPDPVTGETYLFLGDELKLTCTLHGEFLLRYTAHNISFNFSHPFNEKCDNRRLSTSNIEHVNSTSAILTVPNVTMFMNAGMYMCIVEDRFIVGLSQDVYVEYPPQNVTNVHCVLYNWDERLDCTWDAGADYVNKANIAVTSEFSIKNSPSDFKMCPEASSTGCTWSRDEVPVVQVTIRVNVTNNRTNTTASKNVFFSLLNNIKPAPVVDLNCVKILDKPDCLFLSWNTEKQNRCQSYRIIEIFENESFTVLNDSLSGNNFTTCDYPPYTPHNFSVEAYPSSVYSGYWSDPVYTSNWTSMTAPDLGPEIINGSFFTTTECTYRCWNVTLLRSVTVLWKEVNETARNGIIDSYLIKMEEENFTVQADNLSYSMNISCDSMRLEILAHNQGGYSLQPSVLQIPPCNFTVPAAVRDSFAVQISASGSLQTAIRAMWIVDSGAEDVNYIIFWCKGQPGKSCEGELLWREVPGMQTYFDLTELKLTASEYEFGISVQDIKTGMVSGIFWTKCLFTDDLSPDQKLIVESLVESVLVQWTNFDCSYTTNVKVTNYLVTWCETINCCEECLSVTVPANENSYKVPDLQASVNYSFSVQSQVFGNITDNPQWKTAVPLASGSTTSLSLGAVFGGLSGGLLFLAFIFLIYRKCNIGKKKVQMLTDIHFLDIDKIKKETLNRPLSFEVPETLNSILCETTTFTADENQANQDHVTAHLDVASSEGSREGSQVLLLGKFRVNLVQLSEGNDQPTAGKHSPEDVDSDEVSPDYIQQNFIVHQSDGVDQHEQSQADTQPSSQSSGHPDYIQVIPSESDNNLRSVVKVSCSRQESESVKTDDWLHSSRHPEQESQTTEAESVEFCVNHGNFLPKELTNSRIIQGTSRLYKVLGLNDGFTTLMTSDISTNNRNVVSSDTEEYSSMAAIHDGKDTITTSKSDSSVTVVLLDRHSILEPGGEVLGTCPAKTEEVLSDESVSGISSGTSSVPNDCNYLPHKSLATQ